MHTQNSINLTFLNLKGFDTSTLIGLNSALQWLKTAEADCLMHGKVNIPRIGKHESAGRKTSFHGKENINPR